MTGFIPGGWAGEAGGRRRTRLLAARARRRRAPARTPAAAGPGRGARAHAAIWGEQGHRDTRVPRWRPAQPVRGDARALPGGRLPGAGQVRLPQRRRGRAGAAGLRGRTVFCLYPHQTAYVVPARSVVVVPDDVPPARAVLAGTVETAINAAWDAAPLVGDRIAVVGAGMVGCCVARLLSRIPGADVTLVDLNPARADVAAGLGVRFALPDDAAGARDLVVHTSATSAGLQLSLDLLAAEGEVIDLSWYGDAEVRLSLGGVFHSRRLGIRASQVGTVSPPAPAAVPPASVWRSRWSCCATQRSTSSSPGTSRFEELPEVMAAMARGGVDGICHTITYGRE